MLILELAIELPIRLFQMLDVLNGIGIKMSVWPAVITGT